MRREFAGNRVALSAAAVMGIALAAAVVWLVMRHPDRVPEPVRASVDRPLTRLTFDPGLQTDVTFSRDGRSIAYASDRAGNFDIWVQSLDGGEARQLTKSPAQESQPDWSSDGKSIAFRSERNGGGLFVVATEGGAERQLTSFGKYPLWSADASQIFFRSALNDRSTRSRQMAARRRASWCRTFCAEEAGSGLLRIQMGGFPPWACTRGRATVSTPCRAMANRSFPRGSRRTCLCSGQCSKRACCGFNGMPTGPPCTCRQSSTRCRTSGGCA